MVRKLAEIFKCPVLIVCGSWFGSVALLKAVRKHLQKNADLLSRLRVSTRLFDIPENMPPKRGRKRTYGKRLPHVREISGQLKNQARGASSHLYGKRQQVHFSELRCIFGALKCEIRVVFVFYRNFTFPLFPTDLKLTPEQMIQYYAAGWKIKSGFKEIKHEIRALDSPFRKQLSVENHFDLCLFATTFTWLYCSKLDHTPDRLHPTRHPNSFAFADIRRAIASKLRAELNPSKRCSEFINAAVKFIAEAIFARTSCLRFSSQNVNV